MDIEALSNLFLTSPLMLMSAGLFLFNLAITVIEAIADAVFSKHRRWKDTGANVFIASYGRITVFIIHRKTSI